MQVWLHAIVVFSCITTFRLEAILLHCHETICAQASPPIISIQGGKGRNKKKKERRKKKEREQTLEICLFK